MQNDLPQFLNFAPPMKKIAFAAGLGLASLVSQAETGGPDAFGYVFNRTNNPNAFSSIAATGTLISPDTGDDLNITRNIGFNFSFYGQTFTQAFISTNGLTSFLGSNTAFTNEDFSSTNGDIAAAPFWDDLRLDPNGRIFDLTRGLVGNREYVVEWNNVPFFADNNVSVTFQAIFREDGTISYYYPELGTSPLESGLSATIGIRDTDSSANGRFLQNSFNSAYLAQGDVITYSPTSDTSGVPDAGSTIGMLCGALAALAALRRRV